MQNSLVWFLLIHLIYRNRLFWERRWTYWIQICWTFLTKCFNDDMEFRRYVLSTQLLLSINHQMILNLPFTVYTFWTFYDWFEVIWSTQKWWICRKNVSFKHGCTEVDRLWRMRKSSQAKLCVDSIGQIKSRTKMMHIYCKNSL